MRVFRYVLLFFLAIVIIIRLETWLDTFLPAEISDLFSIFIMVVAISIFWGQKNKFQRWFDDLSHRINKTRGHLCRKLRIVTTVIGHIVILAYLAPWYLPVLFGNTTPGNYTGKARVGQWEDEERWTCIYEYETPKGIFEGHIAWSPPDPPEDLEAYCSKQIPESIVYFPLNPQYHYPKNRSEPIMYNYPVTLFSIAMLGVNIFWVFIPLFKQGAISNGEDVREAFWWAVISLGYIGFLAGHLTL